MMVYVKNILMKFLFLREIKNKKSRENVKFNSTYYQEKVLWSIFTKETSFIYLNGFQRVELHLEKPNKLCLKKYCRIFWKIVDWYCLCIRNFSRYSCKEFERFTYGFSCLQFIGKRYFWAQTNDDCWTVESSERGIEYQEILWKFFYPGNCKAEL